MGKIVQLIATFMFPVILIFHSESAEGLKCVVCNSAMHENCAKGNMDKFTVECSDETHAATLNFAWFNYEANSAKYSNNLSDAMAKDLKNHEFRGLYTWQFSNNAEFESIFDQNHKGPSTRVPNEPDEDKKLVCRKLITRLPYSTPHNKKFKGRIIRMCGRMGDDEKIGCQIHSYSGRAATIHCTCDKNNENDIPCNDASYSIVFPQIILVIYMTGQIVA